MCTWASGHMQPQGMAGARRATRLGGNGKKDLALVKWQFHRVDGMKIALEVRVRVRVAAFTHQRCTLKRAGFSWLAYLMHMRAAPQGRHVRSLAHIASGLQSRCGLAGTRAGEGKGWRRFANRSLLPCKAVSCCARDSKGLRASDRDGMKQEQNSRTSRQSNTRRLPGRTQRQSSTRNSSCAADTCSRTCCCSRHGDSDAHWRW